jgi:hypothetical protein
MAQGGDVLERGFSEAFTWLKAGGKLWIKHLQTKKWPWTCGHASKCRGTLCLLGGVRCSNSKKKGLFATIGASPPTTINRVTQCIMDLS